MKLLHTLESWLRLPRAPRHPLVLVLGLAAIVVWQNRCLWPNAERDGGYRQHAAVAVFDHPRFVYFFHHLGLLPVISSRPGLPGDRVGAARLVREHPESLLMDTMWTWMEGDWAKILLYLPGIWLGGDARSPSLYRGNVLGFQLALCALLAAFWWIGLPALGALSVLFAGSNPFAIDAVDREENVHGWVVISALTVLAINLPLLDHDRPPKSRTVWLAPLLTGLFLGTVRGIRPEPATLLAGGLFACLALGGARWPLRLGLAAALLAAFFATDWGWDATIRASSSRRVAC